MKLGVSQAVVNQEVIAADVKLIRRELFAYIGNNNEGSVRARRLSGAITHRKLGSWDEGIRRWSVFGGAAAGARDPLAPLCGSRPFQPTLLATCFESVLQPQRYEEMFCFITRRSLPFEWGQFSDKQGC